MKDLKYHKRFIKERQLENQKQKADQRLDQIGAKVLKQSQQRWNAAINDLKAQRRKLQGSIMRRMGYSKAMTMSAILQYYGEPRANVIVDWVINGGPVPEELNGP